MRKFLMPRSFYIPKGAVKIAAKNSSAVAYLYSAQNGKPAACMFIGKQSKPVWKFYFANEAAREKKIAESFAGVAASAASKAEWKAKRQSAPRQAVVGSIFLWSGGYEQTNVAFYEVVELVGAASVKYRQIGSEIIERNSSMSGQCVPLPGSFLKNSEEKIALAKGNSMKVSWGTAYLMVPKQVVAGCPVYESSYVSWYG
jgi:hypothetical protein